MEAQLEVLDDAEFNEVLRLQRLYYGQALKCEAAKAYLAGCVMLGAALEAALIAMVCCYPDEATACRGLPHQKGSIKPLRQWRLAELLSIAKQLSWLPAGLQLDESWSSKRAKIGDYAEVVRMLRNMVHPIAYLTEHRGRRVTSKHLANSFHILEAAVHGHLVAKVHASLRRKMQEEGA